MAYPSSLHLTASIKDAKEITMDILRILLSILLPPVGVALQVGITTQFWINVLLTLFGYIPGIIHALWVILSRKDAPSGV